MPLQVESGRTVTRFSVLIVKASCKLWFSVKFLGRPGL